MDFRKLEAFSKVYETGSFSRAGKALFLSQPTISAHVADLEEELGVPLFDRMGRTVTPTSAGKALYPHIRDTFDRLAQARAAIDGLRDRVAGTLEVGASTIPARHILPGAIGAFVERYPEVSVRMEVGDSARILALVGDGELDFGVVGQEPSGSALAAEPIMRDELVVVASPALAGRLETGGDIRLWPWVLREKGSGTLLRFSRALEAAGVGIGDLRMAVEAGSTESALMCARSGAGVGVHSLLDADPLIRRGELVILEAGLEPMLRSFLLVHRTGRAVFPATRAFMEHLRQRCRSN